MPTIIPGHVRAVKEIKMKTLVVATVATLVSLKPTPGLAWRKISATYSQQLSTQELRRRISLGDEEAILAAGLKNDKEAIPLLRRLVSTPNPNENERTKRHKSESIPDRKREEHNARTIDIRYRDSNFAARAALTKMKADDYLNDFIAELSTANVSWKIDVIDYLGYIGDARAVKHLGPLLFDDSKPFRSHGPVPVVSAAAVRAMGAMLKEPLAEIQRQNPGKAFLLPEWKKWWKDNEARFK